MDYPSVYLIQIYDRQWGFRIVAVVARDEESALEECRIKFGAQTTNKAKRDYAQVRGSCSTSECGNMATMEFQE